MDVVVIDPAQLTSSASAFNSQRHISLLQLLLLNSIVCGLEFCASAAFTYIPPMLLKAGLDETHMSIVLGIGPLIGLILVPVIGRSSDRCHSRFGRRRPFILGLSVLLLAALIIIPYGEFVAVYAFGRNSVTKNFGVGLLIVGAVLLDFTSQACLTPCEALLSDACKNTNQQERAFTIYSFMVSVGGCIGYLITALDWTSSSVGHYFGGQEQSAFSVLIVLFAFTMFATLVVAQERPLLELVEVAQIENAQVSKRLDQIHQAIIRQKETLTPVTGQDPGYETGSNQSIDEYAPLVVYKNGNGDGDTGKDTNNTYNSNKDMRTKSNVWSSLPCNRRYFHDQIIIPLNNLSFMRLNTTVQIVCHKMKNLVPEAIIALFNIPSVLSRLAVANFFTWSAIMGFNLFYTDFVGQAVYHGNPNAPDDSPAAIAYDEGVRMGSWGLLLHCLAAAAYAPIAERLVKSHGPRLTYFFGMTTFCMAMAVMVFVRHVYLVNLMAAFTGIAYATATTIPFMLVTTYHENKEVSSS